MNLTKIKQIVVVEGVANSGKTTILKKLCDYLKANVPVSDYDSMQLTNQDMCAKARWKDGRIIGVGTAGDMAGCVLENFLYFSDEGSAIEEVGCDVVAIALTTHTKRNCLRYKPHLTAAQIELYDVLIPGFMPSLIMTPQVISTHRIHWKCANCQQVRVTAVNAAFQQLKTLMKV